MIQLVLSLKAESVTDQNSFKVKGLNESLFFYYSPICPNCSNMEEILESFASSKYNVFTIDCSTERIACKPYKGRTVPGLIYYENEFSYYYNDSFTVDAIESFLLQQEEDFVLRDSDEIFDYVEETALDVYFKVFVRDREYLTRFEAYKRTPNVIYTLAKNNSVESLREGITTNCDCADKEQIEEFLHENNGSILLLNAKYDEFDNDKMHVIVFTEDEYIEEDVKSYIRSLYFQNDILLDNYSFYEERYENSYYSIDKSEFPYILVLRAKEEYIMEPYESTYHLNKLLYSIVNQKEEFLEIDPNDFLSSNNQNINIKYESLDDEEQRRFDEDEDFDYDD